MSDAQHNNNDPLDTCMSFLNAIGLSTQYELGASGFVKGIRIDQGKLYVDPQHGSVSSLLHEAGHLAIMPEQFRELMSGDLSEGFQVAFNLVSNLDICPESPLALALIQCSDPEATAWAWAAGKHLGLDDELIIDSMDYQGHGESIRLALQLNSYLGINGLARGGFCAKPSKFPTSSNLPTYPEFIYWCHPIL